MIQMLFRLYVRTAALKKNNNIRTKMKSGFWYKPVHNPALIMALTKLVSDWLKLTLRDLLNQWQINTVS